MELIQLAIVVSALLCSLVAGLVLTFAIVVMPGIKNLGDLGYLQAFKAMDRIIQDNQPLFLLVWVGSAAAVLITTVLGIWQLQGIDRYLLVTACAIYILGVHLPTVVINIPLNNSLQSTTLEELSGPALVEARKTFETRWLRWNTIRTIIAILTTILLLVLLIRL